eukprot:11163279-Lingulodinium_polyedra.AAC.1
MPTGVVLGKVFGMRTTFPGGRVCRRVLRLSIAIGVSSLICGPGVRVDRQWLVVEFPRVACGCAL